ncbi:MAG: tetratricopeptide repeat protein [Sphingomonadaceae bacterium]|nr:tetratricopeptide repeat protein [Sphingomonadaceae bacterium]
MARSFSLRLVGAFRLIGPDGERIDIRGKRSQAMLAMLALTNGGERSRVWLQEALWCNRAPEQANASLRREISNLKKLVNRNSDAVLAADRNTVSLDLSRFDVDALAPALPDGQLLEGLDIAGEENFEDWLRTERQRIAQQQGETAIGRESSVATAPPSAAPLEGNALAVLKFTCEPDNQPASTIADGIAGDLIERLSRMRWLPVLSSSSSFAFTSGATDLRALRAQLGAAYVVEGALQIEGDTHQLRISLGDTTSGRSLRSEQLEWRAADSSAELDRLMVVLAAILGRTVDTHEQQRASRMEQARLGVAELVWRGRWHLNQLTESSNAQARACFEEALAQDPTSSEAMIQLCWLQVRQLWMERASEERIRQARRSAQKAILSDPEDARGHMLAGIAEIFLRQPLRAEALLRRALELNPSLMMAHAQLGSALYLKGEFAEALRELEIAASLSPNDPDLFYILAEQAMARIFMGDFPQAIELADHALALRSGYWIAHLALICAHGELGNRAAAKAALAELELAQPRFSAAHVDWLPFIDPAHANYLKQQLNRAAAMPD